MQRFLSARLIPIAFALYLVAAPVAAADAAPVVESCGNPSLPPPKPSYKWDCSGMTPASIPALEATVVQTHSLLGGKESPRFYQSPEDGPGSAWMFFNESGAARLRALYDGDRWVGITSFCSGPKEACEAFQAAIWQVPPPMPLMMIVGPPPPEAPEILEE